jgi:hypothetical protein
MVELGRRGPAFDGHWSVVDGSPSVHTLTIPVPCRAPHAGRGCCKESGTVRDRRVAPFMRNKFVTHALPPRWWFVTNRTSQIDGQFFAVQRKRDNPPVTIPVHPPRTTTPYQINC